MLVRNEPTGFPIAAGISRVHVLLEEQTSSTASQRQPPMPGLQEVPAAQQKRTGLAVSRNKADTFTAGKLQFVPSFIYMASCTLALCTQGKYLP